LVLVVVGGDASVTSGVDGEWDGDGCDVGKTRVWTASSFASSSDAGRRLERRWFSGLDVALDLLQKKFEGGVREVRRFEAKRIEVRGGAWAHRCWRNLPGMLADMRTSDEESRSPRCGSSRIAKGERERRLWRLYAGV
jgi:hypothetical protein